MKNESIDKNNTAVLQPMTRVRVGDLVRLLPDNLVRIRDVQYRYNPNSSLGIAFDVVLTVTAVEVVNNVAMIYVDKIPCGFNMKRFARVVIEDKM